MDDLVRDFAEGYLHPDWQDEFDDIDGALDAFLESLDQSEARSFAEQLRALVAEHVDDAALETTLEALDWHVFAEESGRTRTMLMGLAERAERHR